MRGSKAVCCSVVRCVLYLAPLLLALSCSRATPHKETHPSRDRSDSDAAIGGMGNDAGPPELAPDADAQPADAASPAADGGNQPEPDAAAPPSSDAGNPPADSGRPEPKSGADAAVNSDAGAPKPDPNDDTRLYASDVLLEVQFTLGADDWNRIRGEGRSLNEVFSYCLDPSFEYSTVPASARVADREVAQLGLRKKGFIGSLSVRKPSLHIDVAQYVKGQLLLGAKALVLNNSLQDASFTHTCMAYAMFRAAGVAAPRCSYAHTVVNGVDLGIYVNVEPIKKPFLARNFGDASGNLYEGSGTTDFRADMLVNFEKKTNEDQPLSPQINQLSDVLARSDDNILADVEAIVDMDQFMRFWATEALIANWDGYTGDLNNFYLYVHPVSHKLVFIPWGTDAAFEHVHPYLRKQTRPQSVYAWSRLPRRLYAIEQSRERYRTTLRTLLTEQWNETALLAEVDRVAALLGDRANASELESQRTFIRNRRAELLQELDGAAPAWAIAERPPLVCQPERNSVVTGSFSTSWGNLSTFSPAANNQLNVVFDGTSHTYSGVYASAGLAGDGTPTVQVGAPLPDGRLVAARFLLAEIPSGPGEVALHGFETYGAVVRGKNENEYTLDGFISSGKIVFDQAAPASGAPLVGHFEGKLITLEPELAAQYSKP